MKRITLAALALLFIIPAQAQILVKSNIYRNAGPAKLEELGATWKNRENAFYYRFRENVSEDLKPSKIAKALELVCTIAEKNEDGTYLALWRTPLGDECVWKDYVVALYDKKKKLQFEVNVSNYAGFEDCEVQDVRYKDGLVYFNMAYITYSSQVNGQCSKLYCFDPKTEEVEWCSPYLCSNGIFIVEEDYVVCGYGFTDEPDFVYLLSRKDGEVLCEMPVQSSPVYYEFNDDGELLVMDYNETVYLMTLQNDGLKVTGRGVRLRTEPSLEGEIFCEKEDGRPTYAMKGDILTYMGEEGDFYHIIYNGHSVYIYKQYGEIVHAF